MSPQGVRPTGAAGGPALPIADGDVFPFGVTGCLAGVVSVVLHRVV